MKVGCDGRAREDFDLEVAPKFWTALTCAAAWKWLYSAQLQTQLPVLVGWVEQEPRVTGGPTDLMQAV
jgi:hypothetical protein